MTPLICLAVAFTLACGHPAPTATPPPGTPPPGTTPPPTPTEGDFYVAPNGTSQSDGSATSPWNLATALSGADGKVKPGDVIWLRGGVYAGDFRSDLTGTVTEPIIVRRYPGERATIQGRLRTYGSFTMYWGFEIRQADAMATDMPTLEIYTPGGRYVNLVIHDAGENGISFRTPSGVSEIHGCIIFNNGNDEGLDHGIYGSSEAEIEAKWVTDNVLFNNIASGVQIFGDDSHPMMRNVHIVGNISFNNSSIATSAKGGEENINIGGHGNALENFFIRDNLLYFSPNVSSGHNLVAGQQSTSDPARNISVTIADNYVVGGQTMFSLQAWEQATVRGNTFLPGGGTQRIVRLRAHGTLGLGGVTWNTNTHYRDPAMTAWRYGSSDETWPDFRAATGLGATDNVTAAAPPSTTKIVLRPNRYEPGRANIGIYNPAGDATVSVDVSAVLQNGDRYELRNVQDIFGPPLLSGTYSGGPLVLPMAGVTPPAAMGRGTAPVTGPYFNAFVLTRAEQ
jgi:hypothetical protein